MGRRPAELTPEHAAQLARIVRRRARAESELWTAVGRMAAAGESPSAIGRALGVSRQAIEQRLAADAKRQISGLGNPIGTTP